LLPRDLLRRHGLGRERRRAVEREPISGCRLGVACLPDSIDLDGHLGCLRCSKSARAHVSVPPGARARAVTEPNSYVEFEGRRRPPIYRAGIRTRKLCAKPKPALAEDSHCCPRRVLMTPTPSASSSATTIAT